MYFVVTASNNMDWTTLENDQPSRPNGTLAFHSLTPDQDHAHFFTPVNHNWRHGVTDHCMAVRISNIAVQQQNRQQHDNPLCPLALPGNMPNSIRFDN